MDRRRIDSLPLSDAFLDLAAKSNERFEYTVAWLDCFAGKNPRGIFLPRQSFRRIAGRNSPAETRGPNLPFASAGVGAESSSRSSVQHALLHVHAAKNTASRLRYDSFFYPLDSVRQWNLLYGKQGFLQYQCVIPETNVAAFEELLERIARSGMGSFLGVLKQFGSAPAAGMLSFPRPGLTLALDFAMRGERTLELMRSLDEVVQQSGGALYPAKDARMSPAMFEASFPRWRSFVPYIDPKMSSSFWRRVTRGAIAMTSASIRLLPIQPSPMRKIVVLGATSGIAVEVQRQLARTGCDLLLGGALAGATGGAAIGSRCCAGQRQVLTCPADLARIEKHGGIFEFVRHSFAGYDTVLLAYGSMHDQKDSGSFGRHSARRTTT